MSDELGGIGLACKKSLINSKYVGKFKRKRSEQNQEIKARYRHLDYNSEQREPSRGDN